MSKVYRYLLRNSDDQLVTLETELQFINSYSYLLKSRYVDGIEISMKINEEDKQQMLPPLTLQVLVEYAHNANMISRDNPLNIRISSLENGWLEIRNNVQKKVVEEEADNSGIENISNKFRLLCQQSVIIDEKDGQKIIQIPLIPQSEMSIV
jgi:LytS/YehU family sensor histidine kinase